MNKVQLGLGIVVLGVLLYIGGLVYMEVVTTLEEHPEIEEFGGPPVITDLRLVAVVVIVAAIVCGIVLKMNPDNDDNKLGEVKDK